MIKKRNIQGPDADTVNVGPGQQGAYTVRPIKVYEVEVTQAN